VGDEVEVVLEAVEDGFGETRLSREKAKRAKAWINLEKSFDAEEIIKEMLKRYATNKMMRLLDRELRRSDLVLGRSKDNEIVLVLPETNAGGTNVLARRISQTVREQLGIDVAVSYASFPDEALTFDDLLRRAEARFYLAQVEGETKSPGE
jgi:hypothetical protein